MNMNKQRARMVEGAKRYALADKSDPFAFDRAMSHLDSGVAGIGLAGADAFYDAEPIQETREIVTPVGVSQYAVTVYHNMRRV